jgi:class 3 adenylate cyclase
MGRNTVSPGEQKMKNQSSKSKFAKVLSAFSRLTPPSQAAVQENAVVGLVDMIDSTRISNTVDLQSDWELRRQFMEAAEARANEFGLLILNFTGDGFLFMVHPDSEKDWRPSLLAFYSSLTADFENILRTVAAEIAPEETGLRFGVSRGTVMLGTIDPHAAHFTAVGPDVNLAARLCAKAGRNEIVLSSRVKWAFEGHLDLWSPEDKSYESVKGFNGTFPVTHVRVPRRSDLSDLKFGSLAPRAA